MTSNHFPDLHDFDFDLPVMIEKFRRDFTASSDGASQIKDLWKEDCKRHQFADQTKLIRDSRWPMLRGKRFTLIKTQQAIMSSPWALHCAGKNRLWLPLLMTSILLDQSP